MDGEFGGAKPKTKSSEKKKKSRKRLDCSGSNESNPKDDHEMFFFRNHKEDLNELNDKRPKVVNGELMDLQFGPNAFGWNKDENISSDHGLLLQEEKPNSIGNCESLFDPELSAWTSNEYVPGDSSVRDLRNDRIAVAKTQELLSAKERWKKSGQALRRYIAEKLGLRNDKHASVKKLRKEKVHLKQRGQEVEKNKEEKNSPTKSNFEMSQSSHKIERSKSFLEKIGIKKNQSPAHKCNKTKTLKNAQSFDSASSVLKDSASSDFPSSLSSHSNVTTESDRWLSYDYSDNKQSSRMEENSKIAEGKKSKKQEKTKNKKTKNKCQKHCTFHKHETNSSKCEQASSDEESFEFTFDHRCNEVVRRPVRGRGKKKGGRSKENELFPDTAELRERSSQLSRTTSDALSRLHYALPYLPERFRRARDSSSEDEERLNSVEKEAKEKSINHNDNDRKLKPIRGLVLDDWDTDNHEIDLSDKDEWSSEYQCLSGNPHTFARCKRLGNKQSNVDCDALTNFQLDLESRLEDPFNVRSDRTEDKIDGLCAGLLDYVYNVDTPFGTPDLWEYGPSTSGERSNTLSSPEGRLLERPILTLSEPNDDGSSKSAFAPMLPDDSLTSSSESDADDEFECDCFHCQPPEPDSALDTSLLPTEEVERPYAVISPLFSLSSGDSSFESALFSPTSFYDGYDLDRPFSEASWLMMENTPLTVMLEDVIQQMLSVQPELLSDQAPPPAAPSVIENLPTVTLTQELIDHHMCCSICLCPCQLEEVMTRLPCQHIFHPICIQGWLVKSGTCPVCRGSVSSA